MSYLSQVNGKKETHYKWKNNNKRTSYVSKVNEEKNVLIKNTITNGKIIIKWHNICMPLNVICE